MSVIVTKNKSAKGNSWIKKPVKAEKSEKASKEKK